MRHRKRRWPALPVIVAGQYRPHRLPVLVAIRAPVAAQEHDVRGGHVLQAADFVELGRTRVAANLGQVPDRHAVPIDALHGQATHVVAIDIPDIAPFIGNGNPAGVFTARLELAGIHPAVGVAVAPQPLPFFRLMRRVAVLARDVPLGQQGAGDGRLAVGRRTEAIDVQELAGHVGNKQERPAR